MILMKTFHLNTALLLGLAFSLCTAIAEAATVRGRLVQRGPHGQIPAAGVAVTVNHPKLGRSPPSYSRSDGMFHITVPAGRYTLEIWTFGNSRTPAKTIVINVGEPSTDIAPVTL